MGKIPIGRTIGQSYEFSFKKYGVILGIIWLPTLLLFALGYFLFWPVFLQIAGSLPAAIQNPADSSMPLLIGTMFGRIFLFDMLVLSVFVMFKVGITKEILGLRKGPRFLYLPTGADELRVIVSYIIIFALIYAVLLAVVLAVALIAVIRSVIFTGTAQHFDPNTFSAPMHAAAFVLIAGVEFVCLYVIVRLSYLLVPATVAEKRIVITRSWELTKGNFWRIILISIVMWVPLVLLESVFFAFAVGPVFFDIATAAHSGRAALAAEIAKLLKNYIYYMPYIWGVGLLISPIYYGLTSAAPAFSYRALLPAPAAAE